MTKPHKKKLFIGGYFNGQVKPVSLEAGRLPNQLVLLEPTDFSQIKFTDEPDISVADFLNDSRRITYLRQEFYLWSEAGRYKFSAYVKSGWYYSAAEQIVRERLERTGLL